MCFIAERCTRWMSRWLYFGIRYSLGVMACLSEASCAEMVRGPTGQDLYPYPEREKPYPVVILDTVMGDITLEVLPTHNSHNAIAASCTLMNIYYCKKHFWITIFSWSKYRFLSAWGNWKPYFQILDTRRKLWACQCSQFYFKQAPKTCKNFLEHCRSAYYEPCLFNRIQKVNHKTNISVFNLGNRTPSSNFNALSATTTSCWGLWCLLHCWMSSLSAGHSQLYCYSKIYNFLDS